MRCLLGAARRLLDVHSSICPILAAATQTLDPWCSLSSISQHVQSEGCSNALEEPCAAAHAASAIEHGSVTAARQLGAVSSQLLRSPRQLHNHQRSLPVYVPNCEFASAQQLHGQHQQHQRQPLIHGQRQPLMHIRRHQSSLQQPLYATVLQLGARQNSQQDSGISISWVLGPAVVVQSRRCISGNRWEVNGSEPQVRIA